MDPQSVRAEAARRASLASEVQRIFGMQPDLDRGNVIPLPDGQGGVMAPQWLYEIAKALTLPGHVQRGGAWSPEDVTNMALTVGGSAGAASLAAPAPKGALRMGAVKRGAELPMDEASRMARAREMGFNVDGRVYHGTPDARGIHSDGFSTAQERMNNLERREGPYFFTNSRKTAASYADDSRAWDYQNAEPEVIEAFIRQKNPLVIDAQGATFNGIHIDRLKAAFPDGPARDNLERIIQSNTGSMRDGIVSTDTVGAIARRFGRDGVVVKNVRDHYNNGPKSKPADVYMVFGANNIRKPSAKFDPSKTDSADLLATSGTPAGLLAPQETMTKDDFINRYGRAAWEYGT